MLRKLLRRFLGIEDELQFRIARVRLEPGDIVLLTTSAALSIENIERLKTSWAALAPETKLVVLDRDMDIRAVFDLSGKATVLPAEVSHV